MVARSFGAGQPTHLDVYMIYFPILHVLTILFTCVLFGLFVECITELITKDEVLDPFRNLVIKLTPKCIENLIAGLLTCGRCASGWISLFVVMGFVVSQVLAYVPILVPEEAEKIEGMMVTAKPLISHVGFDLSFLINFKRALPTLFEFALCWFITWRSANIWHYLIDRLDRRKTVEDENLLGG